MVKMMALVPICFTFLAGLTLCGLVGSTLELVAGRRVSFGEPFVANGHVLRSLAATAGAGPFMLVNEALAAWRREHVPTLFMLICTLLAGGWALATGIVAVDLAQRAAALLS
jgi:hypothetical protein